jgi:LysM repeat protein
VYWARRTLAFAALVVTTTVLALGVRAVVVGLGGGPLTTTGSAGGVSASAAGARVYVTQPGDSLWSIVRASGVRGDPRPVVDRLERKLGDRPLQIGQRVVVP